MRVVLSEDECEDPLLGLWVEERGTWGVWVSELT